MTVPWGEGATALNEALRPGMASGCCRPRLRKLAVLTALAHAALYISCCSARTCTTSVMKGPTLPELVPAWEQCMQGEWGVPVN